MAREHPRGFASDRLAEDLSSPRRYDGLASWVLMGFILLFMAGFVTFRIAGVMRPGNELSVERAVFTSINALTLTGFQQTIGPEQYRPEGHVAIYLLTIGGTLLTLIGGGAAVTRIIGLPFSDRQVIIGAVVMTGTSTIIGGALMTGSGGSFEGLFSAASAFGNSGLVIGPAPVLTNASTWAVLLPLTVAGGIGLTVLMELYMCVITRRAISRHARVVMAMSAAVFILGTVLLASLGNEMSAAGALAINARSAGFPLAGIWPNSGSAKWLLAVLMLLGAGSAGTAGGIKLTTAYELVRGTRRSLAGEPPGRAFGIAVCFVLLFLAALSIGTVALMSAAPQLSFDSVFMLSVSAIGNVGLSQDPVSTTGPGLYILCGLMTVGRLLPMFILWWMAETTRDADIAVG